MIITCFKQHTECQNKPSVEICRTHYCNELTRQYHDSQVRVWQGAISTPI